MRVSVLVVRFQGNDRITLHDDDDQAWSSLVDFVHQNWDLTPESGGRIRPVSSEDRVATFFARADASYILASADLSRIEAHVGDLIEGNKCASCDSTSANSDLS
jgi:hypothetical protein